MHRLYYFLNDPASSSHHSQSRLAQEKVSNPLYVKTSLADSNVIICANNEKPSTLSNTQSQVENKIVVMIEKQENPSAYREPQKRCPSPVYAEVHEDKKKQQQQDCSMVVEEREGNQSPEYSQVENINKHSINQENQDEQHYYDSIEDPVKYGNNEIIFISKHSQESQVVSTQNVLYESADLGGTNTHTEIADSEVNTFPNPCYYTQRHTAD